MNVAAYLRYSSDNQRDASLEDQLRNIRAYCTRMDWPEPTIYRDAALSGARLDRPAYQRLVAAALAGQYTTILVDDLSRLSRDHIEAASTIRKLSFAGVRLIGVSDGVDTARKGHKIDVGLRGLMSELYLDDLAEKTHRGLEGRALAGASAGGLPYGYRVTQVGERAIDPEQAEIVRRIYRAFADGQSARAIATSLNADHIPTARGRTWCVSAIYGDIRRGIGILANPIYIGRQVWNRSQWVKHPETGRRRRIERPRSEWVTTEHPELAIIDSELWDATRQRIVATQTRTRKQRERRGDHVSGGRRSAHLLSGLLHCGLCDGPITAININRYGCATHKDRGNAVCTGLSISMKKAETQLVEHTRDTLLSESLWKVFELEVRAELKRGMPDLSGLEKTLTKARRERDNLITAIKGGLRSRTLMTELASVETAVDEAERALAAARVERPTHLLPRAREAWEGWAQSLSDIQDVGRVRQTLVTLFGDNLYLERQPDGMYLTARHETNQFPTVVAGAGFEPTTFGL